MIANVALEVAIIRAMIVLFVVSSGTNGRKDFKVGSSKLCVYCPKYLLWML